MSIDQRRSPRIEIQGRLHGHLVSLDAPVTVREMSLGGMSIETTFAFPIGAIHEFRLTLGDGSATLLRARVMHSRNVGAPAEPLYVTGLRFEDEEPGEGTPTVGDLIDNLK
jgi:PilZ domain